MRHEHAYAVAEEGRRDHELMRGGFFKSPGGRQVGMHISIGDIQVSGAAARPVGQQMAGGTPEYQEGAPSLEPVRKATTEVGVVPVSVSNVLSVSGAGGVIIWGGDLGVVGGNDQYSGGGPHRFPWAGDGKDGQTIVRRDLEKIISRECHQRSRESETGDVY